MGSAIKSISVVLQTALIGLFLLLSSEEAHAESIVRSSSLQMVTTVEGNVERVDYVDEDGMITYAANKHYATVVKTKGDHYQLDEYFDAEGKPAKQVIGHYAVLREYDEAGHEYKITYLGLDKNPIMIRSGYSMAIRSFDAEGRVIKERYFDTKGNPVLTISLGYGCIKEYNSEGRNSGIIFIDENGNPMISGQGFAIIQRTYYECGEAEGRVKKEFYFDDNNKPIKLALGQYGVYKEYDEFGRTTVVTYLDEDGNPIVTKDGYTTCEFTYHNDDSVETEHYYDIAGNPVAASEGQYGAVKEKGKTIYLDRTGNELFNLRNFLLNNQLGVILFGIIVILISVVVNQRGNILLLILYVLFIIYMTLMDRTTAGTGVKLELFWSYRQIFSDSEMAWEVLNNIWLFIPLGTILCRLFPVKKILLVSVIISGIIEVVQFFSGTGLCELDDIISNGMGGAIGCGFGRVLTIVKRKVLQTCFERNENKERTQKSDDINGMINTVDSKKETRQTMKNTWKVICLAIRASLFKQIITIPQDVDWKDVFSEAQKQAVAGIVRSGIREYLPADIAEEWKLYSFQEVANAVQLLEAQKEMGSLLDDAEIPYCILKGSAAAMYYPEAVFRTMGDVDIIIPEEYFEQGLQILLQNEYNELSDSDTRHIKLVKEEILFELHRYFGSSEKDKLIDVYITKAFDHLELAKIRNTPFWTLPKLENGLVLLTHLRQHLYDGLGIRQVIDWMMYVANGLDDTYWNETFKQSAKEMGLERLAIITTRMCQKYLGLSESIQWCRTANDDVCDQLLDNIVSTGNFGKVHRKGKDVEKTIINLRKEGLFTYLQKAGEFNWKAYHKHHWLKPFAWFYQIFRYIRQGFSGRQEGIMLRNDVKRSIRRFDLLKALGLL